MAVTDASISLVVRRMIRAPQERLFSLWTRPEHLKQWWGPPSVTCIGAELDLRVGGRYRIGNRFQDGREVWIAGEFEVISPPHLLTYTWRVDGASGRSERVTVRFEANGANTEVIVVHERIPNKATRAGHEVGWQGCLDGLEQYLTSGARQQL